MLESSVDSLYMLDTIQLSYYNSQKLPSNFGQARFRTSAANSAPWTRPETSGAWLRAVESLGVAQTRIYMNLQRCIAHR